MQCDVQQKIKLALYIPKYDKALNEFSLPNEQVRFTALPKEMIQMAKSDKTRNPVVILANRVPVGFFVLQSGERVSEYTDNPNALLLIAFSINHNEQGKGYAKSALQQVPALVKRYFPTVNEVVLAVNEKNIPAQKLYEKCGFIDEGRRKMGNIGWQMILSFSLKHV
ncbi:acetyltransferase (GNAT) family protein [Scopulibacillus darangshiensis]|uniref:Acetyltransferase (GNAT) family protein n=1 Tax=Scopulibacillus darangshiensis TaxID=442528 RepID=A0A4R2P4N6_9BACL|nr:GNAT family N-acetyltransferase [Scopulibacillus darangshiensis]TCP29713.1 acetyltransferase (GNAT) family protein [Scopulibacillus darangshiensis]